MSWTQTLNLWKMVIVFTTVPLPHAIALMRQKGKRFFKDFLISGSRAQTPNLGMMRSVFNHCVIATFDVAIMLMRERKKSLIRLSHPWEVDSNLSTSQP
jgi:hypothetical protein